MSPAQVALSAIAALLICLSTASAQENKTAALTEQIDAYIQARLDSEGLRRVPQADDAEFLRRVFLDLHGVVPSAERAGRFLDSNDCDKRSQMIDELLASPRFGEYLANLWRGRLVSQTNDPRKQERFAAWLSDRLHNDSWDKVVYDLLTASGKIEENAAVTYLISGNFPLSVTDLTDLGSRYFLGVRLNCAQCHDHPFVDWKRQEYWGMAAFFAQIQTPGRPKAVYKTGLVDDPKMTLASLQDADLLEGFQLQAPTYLGGEELKADVGQTYRASLARWMTSPENAYFARATANRMWWHFFGRGIVNPVDDMHEGNPPSHPELLELLSRRFVESGFDLRMLCRAILNSRTYQQTSRPGEHADREGALFARMSIKVLSAEQLYDCLVVALGPPQKAPSIDTRWGARYEFSQFYAADGEIDPIRYGRGIPHVLRLMNSPQFTGHNIAALVARLASPSREPDQVVQDLFLTILARRPTAAEQELARNELLRTDALPQRAYQELAWALLMSSEFSLNH